MLLFTNMGGAGLFTILLESSRKVKAFCARLRGLPHPTQRGITRLFEMGEEKNCKFFSSPISNNRVMIKKHQGLEK